MRRSTEKQVVELFAQTLRTALMLIEEGKTKPVSKPKVKHRKDASKLGNQIYPATSKYNPFRTYAWDGEKAVYLGMFPSLNAAKQAQRDFYKGEPPKRGTKARKPAVLISTAPVHQNLTH